MLHKEPVKLRAREIDTFNSFWDATQFFVNDTKVAEAFNSFWDATRRRLGADRKKA